MADQSEQIAKVKPQNPFMQSKANSTPQVRFDQAQAFTDHYYPTFDQNRGALAPLYSDQSVLCFEGQKVQGTQAIVAKLTSLPFQRCQHKVTSLDSHAVPSAGVLVFVTGQLMVRASQPSRRMHNL